jgi:hypothetical protein
MRKYLLVAALLFVVGCAPTTTEKTVRIFETIGVAICVDEVNKGQFTSPPFHRAVIDKQTNEMYLYTDKEQVLTMIGSMDKKVCVFASLEELKRALDVQTQMANPPT